MATADTQQFSNGVSEGTGRWVLVATILASSMAFIDGTALNVALPAIQADLNATGRDLLWIVNAYLLMLASLLLVGGALGDRFGRRRVFSLGIALFTAASVACGLAPSPGFLIGARAVQGVGGALMVPGSLSIITATFPTNRRGAAIGTWSAFTTITTVIGPALGGLLADIGLWRGVFFINAPLGVFALWATLNHVPETRDETLRGPLDIAGAVLIVAGLAGLTYAFTTAGDLSLQNAITDPLVVGALVLGVLALVAALFVESRAPNALMPPRLFASRTFAGANLLTFFLYAALNAVSVFLPLNLVQAQGYREAIAGLTFLPFTLMLAALSRWAGGLVERVGPRLPLTVGPLICTVALFLMGLPGLTGGPADYWRTYFPAILVLGIGMGVTVAPLTTTVMSALDGRHAGTASGINNAISRIGGVLAIAIFGAIMLLVFQSALAGRLAPLDLPEGVQAAMMERAGDLGNTRPPDGLPAAVTAQVGTAVNGAFVSAYRVVAFVSAGMALLSALLAYLLIEDVVRQEE